MHMLSLPGADPGEFQSCHAWKPPAVNRHLHWLNDPVATGSPPVTLASPASFITMLSPPPLLHCIPWCCANYTMSRAEDAHDACHMSLPSPDSGRTPRASPDTVVGIASFLPRSLCLHSSLRPVPRTESSCCVPYNARMPSQVHCTGCPP